MAGQGGGFTLQPWWPSMLEVCKKWWGGEPTAWYHNNSEARFGSQEAKSVDLRKLTWFDNEKKEGGGYKEAYIGAYGVWPPPKPNGAANNGHGGKMWPSENVGPQRYRYDDADGNLILEVYRTLSGKPRFGQRCPNGTLRDGSVKWKYTVKHLPNHNRLLYRLPGLRASGDAAVLICEGEKEIEVENSGVIYETGNNLAIIDEQGRRTLRCCMDAGVERPEFRDFTVNPIDTVMADRGRFIADVLIIARAYLVHLANGGSQPLVDDEPMPPMGDSHKAWSRLVREPLVWLGCADPIASQEINRQSDPATNRLGTIIDAWFGAFGLEAKTLAEVAAYATKPPQWEDDPEETTAATEIRLAAFRLNLEHRQRLLGALREEFPVGRDGINTHGLGQWMRKLVGRISGGLKFVKAEGVGHSGGNLWRLEAVPR